MYDGDVYLVGLHNDPIGDVGEYETNVNTPDAVRAPAYVDPTGFTMGFGDIVGTDSFKGILLHAWLWKAQSFSVNVSTDELTVDSHGLQTSAGPVRVYSVGGALPDGLAAGTDYYVIRTGANTFRLAATAEDAKNGVAIDVTGVGTGTHYLRAIPSFQTIAQRLGWVDTPE